jgi:hypothetical protein
MSTRSLATLAILAVAILPAIVSSPASGFTLSSPSIERAIAPPQIDKAGWGWRGGRWGFWPGAVIGGLAAGAIVGSAVASPYYYWPATRDRATTVRAGAGSQGLGVGVGLASAEREPKMSQTKIGPALLPAADANSLQSCAGVRCSWF